MKKTVLRRAAAAIALLLAFILLASCTNSGPVARQTSDVPSSETPSADPVTPTPSTPTPTPSTPEPTPTPYTPTPVDPVTPTPTTPSPYHDPVFDLKPTGNTTVRKTAIDLKLGTLMLVNGEHPYDWNLAKSLTRIRAERKSKINVSEFDHRVSLEAFEALDAFEQAFEDETGSELTLIVTGAWRDETQQKAFNEKYKDVAGYVTDPIEASEHYTGLCVDLKFWDGKGSYPVNYFRLQEESSWIASGAARFGFIERYSAGKSEITGHPEEIGHFRYVGIAHASYIYLNDLCLEEYLDLLKNYSPNNRLVITDVAGNSWSVYYVPAGEIMTDVPVPEGVVYEISGDNREGYIVSVKSVWEGDLWDEAPPAAVTGVKFNGAGYTVYVGNSIPLTYTVIPANAAEKAVVFTSSDPSVLTVSDNGTVTGVKPGAAIVTITTVDGGFTAEVSVLITTPPA